MFMFLQRSAIRQGSWLLLPAHRLPQRSLSNVQMAVPEPPMIPITLHRLKYAQVMDPALRLKEAVKLRVKHRTIAPRMVSSISETQGTKPEAQQIPPEVPLAR